VKKFIATLIIGAFTFGSIGCSGDAKTAVKTEVKTEVKTDIKTEVKTGTKT